MASRLFGYDVFISFALGAPPRGARSYASDLARRLRERDHTVFFSEDEAPAGEQLDEALTRALARSRVLVVVANRGTLEDPRWVRAEVEEFRRRHPGRPIVPISIGGALQDPRLAAAAGVWLQHADRIWIDDTQAACDQGVVSDDALDRLVTAPHAVRVSRLWRATLAGAFSLLAGLTVIALFFAWSDRRNAERAELNADTARANAVRAEASASEARVNAAQAALNAASAASEADRALRAEGQALREADAARRAERRAQAGRLAAESQLARERDGALAMLLAREAWQLDPGPQAQRALVEALHEPVRLVLATGLGELRHLAYAADGRHVAVAPFARREVHLFTVDGSVPARRLQAAAEVQGLAFGREGRQLLTLDANARLQAWDAVTGRPTGAPVTLPGLARAAVMARRPDGQELAVAGLDAQDQALQRVVRWDLASERLVGEALHMPASMMLGGLAYAPDGRRLAAAGDREVRVWALEGGGQVVPPIPTRVSGRLVAFLDRDTLLVDGPGYEMTRWFLPDHRAEAPTYGGHHYWVTAVAHSPSSRLVAIASQDGSLRVWRDDHPTVVGNPLPVRGWDVGALAFSADGTELLSASRDGQLLRWLLPVDAHRHRKAGVVEPAPSREIDVTHGVDGRWSVRLDLVHGTLEWQDPAGLRRRAGAAPEGAREGLAVASDGSLALRSLDDRLTLHAAGQARARCRIDAEVHHARFRPDGRQLLTWSRADPTLRLWDADRCRALASLPRRGESTWLRGVEWAHDGRRVWVAGDAGVEAWDPGAPAGQAPRPVLDAREATRLAVDPKGRFLAAAGGDAPLRLVDLRRRVVVALGGGTGAGGRRALRFSPDGRWLASADDDAHALWDPDVGELAGRIVPNRQGQLRDLRFSADGQTLITASTDGPDRHWELDPAGWAAAACAAAHRNLRCDEWRRLVDAGRPWRPTCPQWPAPDDLADCGKRP